MKIFKEIVVLESSKSREEIIALIDKNIEPYHKDSSNLIFEGRITPEGKFEIKLAEVGTYKKRFSVLRIQGRVKEGTETSVYIEYSVMEIMRVLFYIIGVVMISFSMFLLINGGEFNGVLIPWFIPVLFYVFTAVNLYFTLRYDKKKAEAVLRSML